MLRKISNEDEAVVMQIEVTDSGIGISKEKKSEIFRIFGQGGESCGYGYAA